MVVILPQQKALFCYFLLLIWILIIIFGIYKYIGFDTKDVVYRSSIPSDIKYVYKSHNSKNKADVPFLNYGKLYKSCNILSSISLGTEGKVNSNYTLEGVLIFFRHGDRGPLYHIRDMLDIHCSANDPYISSSYKDFTSLLKSYSSSQSNFPFPFLNSYFHHSLLPHPKYCEIGQLTLLGVQQLLKLGQLLKLVYYNHLTKNGSMLYNNDIFVYSTKYRRTLLSASSFLYGFFKTEDLHKITFREAFSFSYCFDDCACPATEVLKKAVTSENSKRLKFHPAILKLIEHIGPIVFTSPDTFVTKDVYSLKDALLAYICHNAKLPCSRSRCVNKEDVSRLFSYVEWDTQQAVKYSEFTKFCLLKAYGLVKNIVSHLLKIVSEKRPKIVVYSAHDKTIQVLLTAFGILIDEAMFPKYGSRAIIEIYRNTTSITKMDTPVVEQYFFRLVFNGKDVTKKIKFCKKTYREIHQVDQNTKHTSKSYLCSIESVVRFLHDDYFSVFNSTNFKDACEYKFFNPY